MSGIDWARFGERDLADCVVTRFRGKSPDGETWTPTWAELFAWLTTPTPWAGDWQHPSFAATLFSGTRSKGNARELFALTLDIDGGCSEDEIRTLCAGRLAAYYSTKSGPPRWRVVLPYRYSLSPAEHHAVAYELAEYLPPTYDRAASGDAARFWFGPAKVPGVEFVAGIVDGEPFDPEPWLLRRVDRLAIEEREAARIKDDSSVHFNPATADIETRAIAYLDRLEPAISGAGGHKALFRAASVLKRLDESTAYRLLRDHYNPRCVPPWSDKEILRKVREGAKSSQIGGLR